MARGHYDGYHRTHQSALWSSRSYWLARAQTARSLYFDGGTRARVFEYGCGLGQNIALLPNAAGWDISEEARRFAAEHGVSVYDGIEDVPTNSWEVVFSRHVLEHVPRPLDALSEMKELLAPEGTLFLVLPKEEHHESRYAPDQNRHLHSWTFRTIFNLLDEAGFEPFDHGTRYPFGWLSLMPVYKRFGFQAYYKLSRMGEALHRNGELWIKATLPAMA